MAAPRQLTPIPRNRAPLPTRISIADFTQHELAEFIDPIELPNQPLVLDIAAYEPEHDD
jgi:hypothetical protein